MDHADEVVRDFSDSVRTIMATETHPVSECSEQTRVSYLKAVAVVAYADGEYHPMEKRMLRDLAEILALEETEAKNAESLMKNANAFHVEFVCTDLRKDGVGDLCIADMIRMAGADSVYRKEEKARIKEFAGKLGVGDSARKAMEKFILEGKAIEGDMEGILKNEFLAAGLDPDRFAYLLEGGMNGEPGDAHRDASPDEGSKSADPKAQAQTNSTSRPAKSQSKTGAQLRLDVVRNAQKEILSQIAEIKGYIQELVKISGTDESKDQLEKSIARLDAESLKVRELRFTLAFIGTMKAGKSTTINAIVGSDILPNRSGAMTTLPTLVTHTEGQKEPRLLFRKPEPFREALRHIREKLKTLEADESQGQLYKDALERIRSGVVQDISGEYLGEKDINDFMVTINDISRICIRHDLENPLDFYASIADFPEIEIEFSYLKDRVKESVGKLSVIDTPGPNEAGQGHLKGIVKTQLATASAIVCVADPFQADSEAQAELRDWISEARQKSGVPLFVLWNKLDMLGRSERKRTAADWEAKARNLFPDVKCENGSALSISGKTFPISSRQGLLSNMASRVLKSSRCLPSEEENEWVAGFLEAAYGGAWEDELDCLDDANRHRDSSDKMWMRSKMAEPMENIVVAGLDRAAQSCLKNAADITMKVLQDTIQAIQIPMNSIDAKLEVLEGIIDAMKNNIETIRTFEIEAEKRRKDTLSAVSKQLERLLGEMEKSALELFDKDFKKKKNELAKPEQAATRQRSNPWTYFLGQLSKNKRQKDDIDKIVNSDDILKFSHEKEAEEFTQNILKEIQKLTKKSMQKCISNLEEPVKEASVRLAEFINEEVQKIKDGTEGLLQTIETKIPVMDIQFPKISLDLDLMECSLVRSERYTYTYTERRWYTLGLWKHEVEGSGTRYKVEPKEMRKTIKSSIGKMLNNTENTVNDFVDLQFRQRTEEYLKSLREEMRKIQASVDEGIFLKQSEEKDQQQTKKQLSDLKEKFEGTAKRTEKVKKMVQEQSQEASECATPA